MSRIKELVQGSLILVVSNILLKAVNFFLLPLYTHFLTPDLLGISDTITNFTSLLFVILVLALDAAFGAFYYDKKSDSHQDKVFNTIWVVLTISGILPIILMLFSGPISKSLFKTDEYSLAIVAGLASVSLNLWQLPFALRVRLQNRMVLFAIVSISSSLCMVLLNILLLTVFHVGYYALILSIVAAQALQLTIYLLFSKISIRIRLFDFKLFIPMLKYSLPMLPVAVASWVVSLSDRYLLLFFGYSNDDIGIYGVASRFVMVLTVLTNALFTAYPAFAFRSYQEGSGQKEFPRVLNVLFLLISGIGFTVAMFGREIIALMTTPDYASAYSLLPELMFAQVAYGLSVVVGYGISFMKKSVYNTISVCVSALANLVLNIIFIPRFGLTAAVTTTLVGYCIMLGLNYIFAQRLYPCQYEIVRILLMFAGLYAIARFTDEKQIMIKALIWAACTAVSLIVFHREVAIILGRLKVGFLNIIVDKRS